MRPMGRQYYKSKVSKHYVKINGKYHAWWQEEIAPSKTREKQQAKKDIQKEILYS